MVAPSFSGQVVIRNVDISVSGTTGITGSASIAGSSSSNNERVYLSDVTAGDLEFYEIDFDTGGPEDLTDYVVAFSVYFRFQAESANFGLYSSASDRRMWPSGISGGSGRNSPNNYVLDPANTADSTDTGTFDITSVQGFRIEYVAQNTTSSNAAIRLEFGETNNAARDIFKIPYDGLIAQDGEALDPIRVNGLLDHHAFMRLSSDVNEGCFLGFEDFIQTPFSFQVGDNSAAIFEGEDTQVIYFSPKNISTDSRVIVPQANRKFIFDTTTANTVKNLLVLEESGGNGIIFEDRSSATNTWESISLSVVLNAILGNGDYSFSQISGVTGTVSGGNSLSSVRIDGTSSTYLYEWNGSTTFSGSCEMNGSADHYINFPSSLSDGATFDASDITFGTPTTNVFRCDIGAGKTLNITVSAASGLSNSDVTVVSGSVNVSGPQPQLTLTGLIAGSRVYVRNTTDGVDLFNTVEATTEFTGTVPASKALLIRVRNASGDPKYKPFRTTSTGLTGDASIVVNQELDE